MEPSEFKLNQKGIKSVLPALEAEIMEYMWKIKEGTAGEVYEYLKQKHPEIRRSTVSILMNRLCEKGLLTRRMDRGRGGIKYIYTVTTTREEFERKIVEKIIDSLIANFREATYAYLAKKIKK
ncbi:BlaI/MecI/CopY family transcriptional regulator [Pyrococcus horikoshii]|uniref:CopY family transcriptional regulator n=2 Tax=Pyrococcus horikoshii TaxID=53953 RepID=O59261_PYRHO|nr:BlaI/MecI/CopY family transcriptional regulator [Pyrococcus horikoshii]BAA30699.1 122aa long hypothetical protein [Pyrococcus horikoshii OT3]HII60565.1 CopY family transcriptional regulator [Pyrococcus horikoshii]